MMEDVKFKMGIYTKAGYELLRKTLRCEAGRKLSSVRRNGQFVSEFEYTWIQCAPVPCLHGNYVNVAPDGELYFIVVNRMMWTKTEDSGVTPKKVANALMNTALNRTAEMPKKQRAELLEGAKVIGDYLTGHEDRISDVQRRKWIGCPLDPFKQAMLQMCRESLMNDLESFRTMQPDDVKIPGSFAPSACFRERIYAHHLLSQRFTAYIGCLA